MNDNLILTALAATKAGPGASRTDILANLATIVDLAGELDEIGPALADAATFAPAGARGEFLAELLSCHVPAGKDGHRRGSSIIRGATVVKVERINRGGHDKCQVTYRALSYYDMKRKRKLAEPVMSEDTITTDWLSNPEAQAVEARAKQLAGVEGGADLWKHLVGAADDTEKKDGDQDDGFKELFYISNSVPSSSSRPASAPAPAPAPNSVPVPAPASPAPEERPAVPKTGPELITMAGKLGLDRDTVKRFTQDTLGPLPAGTSRTADEWATVWKALVESQQGSAA